MASLILGLCLSATLLTAARHEQAATVVKKVDGTAVTGSIAGLVVLKDLTIKTEGAKTTYSVTYFLLNGNLIESITEGGVKYRDTGVGTCTASQDAPFDDLDVLTACSEMSGTNPLEFGFTKQGGSVVKMGLRLSQPPTYSFPVLGQFRKGAKGLQIVPALEVATEKGTVTVPVASIVRFKDSRH